MKLRLRIVVVFAVAWITCWLPTLLPQKPVTESLEVFAVEMNDVFPSSRHLLEICIQNNGTNSVGLLSAKPSCGCIDVKGVPVVVEPSDHKKLNVEFAAPSSPGPFEKTVLVASRYGEWQCPIRGVVLDVLRAEPAQVFLDSSRDGSAPMVGRTRIYTDSPKNIKIENPSRDFTVTVAGMTDQWVGLAIEGLPKGHSGTTEFRVTDGSSPDGIDVPIKWSPARRFKTLPDQVAIDSSIKGKRHPIDVLILGEDADKTKVKAANQWTRVTSSKILSNAAVRVTLSFSDPPPEFEGAVASISFNGDTVADIVGTVTP